MACAEYQEPDRWWDHYGGEYAQRTWRSYRHLLAEAIVHAESGPLLDVGCGLGFLVECARRFGIDAYGLEASAVALEKARRLHPAANLRSWSAAERLPFEASSIGICVLNEFVDHIDMPSNRALFTEMGRVLRERGVILVKSPSRHNRFDRDLGHVSFFSPSEFRRFVESFGFRVLNQPFSPQPLLGNSSWARRAMRILSTFLPKDLVAARIDLVAMKQGPEPACQES